MRPTKVKQQKAGVKLPSIGNRTFGDMSTQSLTQKQRPSSSKNIVNDLEKKLFSQLDAYQQKASTLKNTRKSINKNNTNNKKQSLTSNSTNAYLMSNSCKQIANMNLLNTNNSGDFGNMQKLAQLMPQLYSKIINNKKYEEDYEPLKESNITNNTIQSSNTLITEIKPQLTKTSSTQSKNISKQPQPSKNTQKSKTTHSSILSSKSNPNAHSLSISRTKQQKQSTSKVQQMDSFAFAQNQVNKIYKQYLQQQGLEQDNYDFTSMDDLQHMNSDLQKCQVDIQQLQKNYQKLIRQLGNICVNDLEDQVHGDQ